MASETILVADDDKVVVQFLSERLSSDAVRVIGVADAMQVLMSVRRSPPSAILLDIMMPGGTGFEVLKRLRSNAQFNSIPVIAMSSSADPELAKEAQALGANGFLLKPLQVHEVVATLERLLPNPRDPASKNTSVWRRCMMSSPIDPHEQNSPTPEAPSTAQSETKPSSAAAQVWAEYRNVILERMSAIDTAVTALRRAKLTDEVRQKAVLEAHRLAGSLGMFGLMEGTRLAREIEHLFGDQASIGPGTPRQLNDLAAGLRSILEKGIA
jgi:CheY-like chemotaxis protein/HPt (histidine-containing phosphotransfer) domain-containing protein